MRGLDQAGAISPFRGVSPCLSHRGQTVPDAQARGRDKPVCSPVVSCSLQPPSLSLVFDQSVLGECHQKTPPQMSQGLGQ